MTQTPDSASQSEHYIFTANDPYDFDAPIQLVVPLCMSSYEYMREIHEFRVPENAIAVWFLGQNGFILKDATSPLIGIDLYLTNSCADLNTQSPFRLDRQLPIFVEPEDLDVDVFLTTHSHQDHADPETIRRLNKTRRIPFIGPFDSVRVYEECGVPEQSIHLIHPGESLCFGTTSIEATFAVPTDATDLNHTGALIRFGSGITFLNSGDTAWADRLPELLPRDIDVCTICINGGYHNLHPEDAARIICAVRPSVTIPCHYDMMINNVGSPEKFAVALDLAGAETTFKMLRYYEPWIYQKITQQNLSNSESGEK